jgi:two-component system cell cycle sensor histidine kinase/response regulator CckA
LAGDKRLSREVGLIQTTADRAAALTRQLLAFSRDQILQPRVVSLREVVRKMAGLLDRIIGEDVDIEIDVPDGLPSVELDPVQLEQVILNLAVNARDAMPGGGTLTLSARREDLDRLRADDLGGIKPGVYTVLEVSDTGAGMDEETLARAFEPFFTTKARGKGTGLGLSGAYGFVTQTGGSIRVDSDVGRGTTFVLRFPAVEGAPLPVAGTPTRGAEIPARDRGAVILVVEDTEEVREAARKILERSEFVVEVARTAEAGLEVLEKRDDIGLVLTDLVLPGMSGRALVERLRASRPDLPVLVMSGYADDSPGHPGDLPPDIPFLPKPFAVGTLLRAIAEAMGADGSGP